jgi:hypothetical protein
MTPNAHSPTHSLRRQRQVKPRPLHSEEKENGATLNASSNKRPLSSTPSIVKSKTLNLASGQGKTPISALQDITNILSSAAIAVKTNTHLTNPKASTPSNLRNTFCIFEQESTVHPSEQKASATEIILPPEYAPVLEKLDEIDDIPIELEAFIDMRTISTSRMACPLQEQTAEAEESVEFERERPELDDEEQENCK